jgi:hypothetical protein
MPFSALLMNFIQDNGLYRLTRGSCFLKESGSFSVKNCMSGVKPRYFQNGQSFMSLLGSLAEAASVPYNLIMVQMPESA